MEVLEPAGQSYAVVLVAHGLNLQAHAMREVYEPLLQRGATIVLLRLRGHVMEGAPDAEVLEEWRSVEPRAWLNDWRAAVRVADQLASSRGVPLVFVGYSLGTLVHVHGLATTPDRKSTRLNSSHIQKSRMPSSA